MSHAFTNLSFENKLYILLEWGYGFLAVAIVSLCSVFGVAIIPVMDKVFYHKIVLFLIALAVGTLVGDAMLHLFPHVRVKTEELNFFYFISPVYLNCVQLNFKRLMNVEN